MGIKTTKVAPDLQFEIEQFYYHEAELLDDHLYSEWLDLFAGDARYWMPTRANRLVRERGGVEAPVAVKTAVAQRLLDLYGVIGDPPPRSLRILAAGAPLRISVAEVGAVEREGPC